MTLQRYISAVAILAAAGVSLAADPIRPPIDGMAVEGRGTDRPAETDQVDGSAKAANYELVRVLEVAGRQGIATDGRLYFVSGSKALYIYSKQGELLKTNKDPFAELERPANHFGDISEHKGELYTGVEWFEDGRGSPQSDEQCHVECEYTHRLDETRLRHLRRHR